MNGRARQSEQNHCIFQTTGLIRKRSINRWHVASHQFRCASLPGAVFCYKFNIFQSKIRIPDQQIRIPDQQIRILQNRKSGFRNVENRPVEDHSANDPGVSKVSAPKYMSQKVILLTVNGSLKNRSLSDCAPTLSPSSDNCKNVA